MPAQDAEELLYALDALYYATVVCGIPVAETPALGETIAIQAPPESAPGRVPVKQLAPSTRELVEQLCSADLFTSRAPHVTYFYDKANPQFYTAWANGLQAAQAAGPNATAEFVPIATVEWDNAQLRWPTGDEPPRTLCASGECCAALGLAGAPGPLPAYTFPAGGGDDPRRPQYCLLCIREDVNGLVLHSEAKAPQCGRVVALQPPFKNLVGCPGGYDVQACSVVPGRQQLFTGGVHIVGSSGHLRVRYDAAAARFWVDQSMLQFVPNGPSFLARGASALPAVSTN